MAKSRTAKKLLSNITKSDAEQAFADFAKADAQRQKITASQDLAFAKIREKNQDEMNDLDSIKEAAFEIMQSYATNNRDEFGKKKSMEFAHGVLGFRTGTPKLKTLKGFTWSSCTNLIKEFLPSYIRTAEEPAKDRLLSDRETPEVAACLSKVGLMVDQDETFFVEPKKEIVD